MEIIMASSVYQPLTQSDNGGKLGIKVDVDNQT